MADTDSHRLSIWRQAITFDRAVNGVVIVYVVVTLVALFLVINGLTEFDFRQSDLATLQEGDAAGLDAFFIILYTSIALLYAQNLLFFYQTRERVHLTYCFYITFMAIHVVFYGQLETLLGMPLPEQVPITWNGFASLAAHNISMVFIFRFARQLLDSERSAPMTDQLLKLGMVFAFFPSLLAYFISDEIFYVFDSISTLVFGAVILVGSLIAARQGNTAARILFFSYLAQYVGFFWSYVIYVFPDMASVFNPFYAGQPFMAEASIWISALFVEALLMSLAAQQHVRTSKAAAASAEDRAARLERAIRDAQAKLAEQQRAMARVKDPTDQSIGQPAGQPTSTALAQSLRDIIKTNASETFVDVSFLASATAMSKATLLRRLKQETGQSPSAFIRQVRLDMARDLLDAKQVRTVGEAMTQTGFSSMGHFAKAYRDAFRESPADTLKSAERKG